MGRGTQILCTKNVRMRLDSGLDGRVDLAGRLQLYTIEHVLFWEDCHDEVFPNQVKHVFNEEDELAHSCADYLV